MKDNSKQIKRQRGYEGRFLTASLVCGFDFLNFFHRLIALHRLLDEQVIKANDVIKFNDDSKKATDALNKILDDTTDEDEIEQFIEYFEKKEEYELRHFYELNHFLEKDEKEQYEISQCVETLNRIEETEQIKEFCNDVEKLSRVAYETDLLEKEKQIKKIDNELQLDVIAGKIIPINLSSNGMTFDFVEFYNWAVSKGHELPPDINAFLTMSLSEFDEWCIKNNYSPPKRFAIARSKASQRVIVNDSAVSIETTEPVRTKVIQANSNEFEFSGLLNNPRKKDGWFRVIDDMTRAFYSNYGKKPDRAQAWAQLWETPPDGYKITVGTYRGEDCLKMPAEKKPLSISMFNDRWKKYTTQMTE